MLEIIPQKRCTKCGQEKEISEFSKQKGHSAGIRSICKKCGVEDVKRWREENPEKSQKKSRDYYIKNKDLILEKGKEYHKGDKNFSSRCHKWYISNSEKVKQCVRQWRKENPEKVALQGKNRRALVRGGVGKITSDEWKDLCNKYGNKCLCCGKENVELTLDHIIPVSKGGCNTIENSQPLCSSCNSRKYIKTIDYRPK